MQLAINDSRYEVPDAPDRPLLWVLRDELGLIGTRFGCGAGLCGACTIHLDGAAARACVVMLSQAEGLAVRTIEGLADAETGTLHPVQQAFIDEQVPQCGWCMSGQIMAAAALLGETPDPSDDVLDQTLTNLCRCGCYVRIRRAVRQAAAEMRS